MTRWLCGGVLATVLVAMSACSGDDSSSTSSTSPTSTSAGIASLSGLQAQLASLLLQPSEVPQGLEVSSPAFSTNQDLAGPNADALQKMIEQGRQLGVDEQYIPTDRLDPGSPIRGGIQSSASLYTQAQGASDSFQETVGQARANNWQANYPDISDLQVIEVDRKIGDETLWLRIQGIQCQSATPTPGPGASPPVCPDPGLLLLDNVVFRVGRVRAFVQVSSLLPPSSPSDSLLDDVEGWADIVAGRADSTFPTS